MAIGREAIATLDAEGTEALSMRKLGARLNAGATSLYRHVATKDELIELAVDEVFGEVAIPDAGGPDWRAAATEAGFPEPSGAIDALLSYVIGMSTTEAAWLTTIARSGETEASFISRLMPAARQASGDHPVPGAGAGGHLTRPGRGAGQQVRVRPGHRPGRSGDPDAALRACSGAAFVRGLLS